jgi:hypothetical protein
MGVVPNAVSMAQSLATDEEEGVVGLSERHVCSWLHVMLEGEQDLYEESRGSSLIRDADAGTGQFMDGSFRVQRHAAGPMNGSQAEA